MRYLFLSTIYLVVLFFQGCLEKQSSLAKTANSHDIGKEKQLVQRFQNYWQHRSSCEIEKAFYYELPYQQYLLGLQEYLSQMDRRYCDAKVSLEKIEFNKENPNIAIIVRKVKLKNGHQYLAKDKWIYVDNQWYHKFYQTIFPPEEEEADFQ